MDANKILQSDVLDLLFEGRNKAYGAYQLRKKYNTHLTIALCGTAAFALTVFLSSLFFGKRSLKADVKVGVVELVDIIYPPREDIPEKKIEQPQFKKVATEDFVTVRIEKDELVKSNEMPDMDALAEALIGTEKQEGEDPDGRIMPPTESASPTEVKPEVHEDPDLIQDVVDVEAEFPGGNKAWARYVSREIERNMEDLQDEGRSGTVMAVFVVDRDGAVSEVKVLPCEQVNFPNCVDADSKLADIALKTIRKGPKWKPAMKNGRNVKAYRKQQITFRLEQ